MSWDPSPQAYIFTYRLPSLENEWLMNEQPSLAWVRNDVVGAPVFTRSGAKQGKHQGRPGHTHNPDWVAVSRPCLFHRQQRAWKLPVNPTKPNYLLPVFFSKCTTGNPRRLAAKSNLAQGTRTAEEGWEGGTGAQTWQGAWDLVSFPHQSNL